MASQNTLSIKAFVPGILCLGLTFYLLTLPGSSFPRQNWFEKIQLDKWIHISMFATLTGLFYWPFKNKWNKKPFTNLAFLISTLALAYGIGMEYVQKYFVANRSFDVYDIVADGVGSYIPFALRKWAFSKFIDKK